MRISDWSSDVCSSDLLDGAASALRRRQGIGLRARACGTRFRRVREPQARPCRPLGLTALWSGAGEKSGLSSPSEQRPLNRESILWRRQGLRPLGTAANDRSRSFAKILAPSKNSKLTNVHRFQLDPAFLNDFPFE